MNWIKLLFPTPKFDVAIWPRWLGAIHRRALNITYYSTQAAALMVLTIIYVFFITPLAFILRLKQKALLDLQINPRTASYLKRSAPLSENDFEKMY
jgi:hypothetical protein